MQMHLWNICLFVRIYACLYVCKHMHIRICLIPLHSTHPLLLIIISQALEHDVEAFVSEVQKLEKNAHQLVSQGHFDTANISARQVHACAYLYYAYTSMDVCVYACPYRHTYMHM